MVKNIHRGLFWVTHIIFFLTKLDCNSLFLRTYRKYAIVLVLIIAIVTPPDVVSQTIVAIPMLYPTKYLDFSICIKN
jgi:sec-independent protein translocase protein TatC